VKPALLITNQVTHYREEPFRMLAEAEQVEILPWAERGQIEAVRAAAGGGHRAVICGLGGRLALPGSFAAARRAGVPWILWASLWGHPRSSAHVVSWLPTRELYRRADAVVTYGPHVTRYVAGIRGSDVRVFDAPQAVDARLFGRHVQDDERRAARERLGAGDDGFALLFVGRLEREKGVRTLLEAWRAADLGAGCTLSLAGEGPLAAGGPGVRALGRVAQEELPALYAAADALVLPSIRTATFLEPWGLVCNEAMHQGTPILATDAVGAVAGGLVVDGRNGLVAAAGDAAALAARIRALAGNPALRAGLGAAAKRDVGRFTYVGWLKGFSEALAAVGAGKG
jgi:glycosyltransferase involved in cell wall biosynthesis